MSKRIWGVFLFLMGLLLAMSFYFDNFVKPYSEAPPARSPLTISILAVAFLFVGFRMMRRGADGYDVTWFGSPPPYPAPNLHIAEQAIKTILTQFPSLRIEEHPEDPVELSVVFPEQEGLKHKVCICLQNIDELYFGAGHFWCSWFPCTDPDETNMFVENVIGFISGRYRILERYRGERCVAAELQRPIEGGWETMGRYGQPHLPTLQEYTFKEIRNA